MSCSEALWKCGNDHPSFFHIYIIETGLCAPAGIHWLISFVPIKFTMKWSPAPALKSTKDLRGTQLPKTDHKLYKVSSPVSVKEDTLHDSHKLMGTKLFWLLNFIKRNHDVINQFRPLGINCSFKDPPHIIIVHKLWTNWGKTIMEKPWEDIRHISAYTPISDKSRWIYIHIYIWINNHDIQQTESSCQINDSEWGRPTAATVSLENMFDITKPKVVRQPTAHLPNGWAQKGRPHDGRFPH